MQNHSWKSLGSSHRISCRPFSLTDPSGIAALNHEVTRQATMIAYNDDFALMLIVILASLPLLLLVRGPRREPMPAAADD